MNPGIPCALLAAIAPLVQAVEVGDVPTYTFDHPPLNGMGATSLADLRGKPVFIEFWGRRAAAVDDTVREALAWQEAWGDDLTVLFSEAKNASELEAASFAMHKKWLGGRALWTAETPCRVGLKGALPQFVLLSSEGVVLLKGTTESFELGYRDEVVAAIEQHIEAEANRRRRGPADLPAPLAPAWESFAAGRVAEAVELAQGLAADHEADAALAAAATETLATFRERLERDLARAERQIETGHLPDAEASLARLDNQLADLPPLATHHARLTAALADESLEAEWKAARALAKLEAKLYSSGPKSVLVKQIERLARRHAGTRSAERAAYLVRVAETSPFK